MTGFLLAVHIVAAILAIGPVAVSTSMFPPAFRAALDDPDDSRKTGTVLVLVRVTRVHSIVGVVVPVFGVATATSLGVLTDTWLLTSMALTAAAAALLVGLILPAQRRLLDNLDGSSIPEVSAKRSSRRLAMHVGLFNLLWVIVVALMIYRPGSTTGVS